MKVMLDTNVLISALVFGGKAREILLMLIGTEHKISVSDYVAKEFSDKVRLKWTDKSDMLLKAFHSLPFYFCRSSEKLQGTLRDKKDIPVLSDALYHQVDVILTGDKDFLEADLEKPLIFSIKMLEEFLITQSKTEY